MRWLRSWLVTLQLWANADFLRQSTEYQKRRAIGDLGKPIGAAELAEMLGLSQRHIKPPPVDYNANTDQPFPQPDRSLHHTGRGLEPLEPHHQQARSTRNHKDDSA
jgi:hypothetical protein